MSEELDQDLQSWFARSDDDLPPQPFAHNILEQLRRRERGLRLLRHAALLAAFASVCLLLPQLAGPLSSIATLPFDLLRLAGAPWTFIALALLGCLGVLARIRPFRIL